MDVPCGPAAATERTENTLIHPLFNPCNGEHTRNPNRQVFTVTTDTLRVLEPGFKSSHRQFQGQSLQRLSPQLLGLRVQSLGRGRSQRLTGTNSLGLNRRRLFRDRRAWVTRSARTPGTTGSSTTATTRPNALRRDTGSYLAEQLQRGTHTLTGILADVPVGSLTQNVLRPIGQKLGLEKLIPARQILRWYPRSKVAVPSRPGRRIVKRVKQDSTSRTGFGVQFGRATGGTLSGRCTPRCQIDTSGTGTLI